jgi:hypothetical protein
VVAVSSTVISWPRTTSTAAPRAPISTALLGSTGARRKTTPTTNGATIIAPTAGQCVASRAARGGSGPVRSQPSSEGATSSAAVP